MTSGVSLGADQVAAIDDGDALNAVAPVDVGRQHDPRTDGRAPDRQGEAGRRVRSVTGAPDNAKHFPAVRVVPFVSKQDAKTVLHMAQAVSAGRLVIPIDRKLPLKDAAAGHAAVENGVNGKVLLLT